MEKKYWIYILLCKNGSLYTGYTTDMVRRYRQHRNGTGRAKYTLSFKPIRIARCWQMTGTRGSALRIERLIKGRNRKEKEYLVENPEALSRIIHDELGLDTALVVVSTEFIEKETSAPHTDDAEL